MALCFPVMKELRPWPKSQRPLQKKLCYQDILDMMDHLYKTVLYHVRYIKLEIHVNAIIYTISSTMVCF